MFGRKQQTLKPERRALGQAQCRPQTFFKKRGVQQEPRGKSLREVVFLGANLGETLFGAPGQLPLLLILLEFFGIRRFSKQRPIKLRPGEKKKREKLLFKVQMEARGCQQNHHSLKGFV